MTLAAAGLMDTDLYHRVHVTLGAGELCGVLDPHEHHEVQVVPHVMLTLYMFLEGHCLIVKG